MVLIRTLMTNRLHPRDPVCTSAPLHFRAYPRPLTSLNPPDPRLQQKQLRRQDRNGPDKRKWIWAKGTGRGRGVCATVPTSLRGTRTRLPNSHLDGGPRRPRGPPRTPPAPPDSRFQTPCDPALPPARAPRPPPREPQVRKLNRRRIT